LEPGGGDAFENLNEEERDALNEATQLGFPLYDWFLHKSLDDGALPILAPLVSALDPSYFTDFWTLPGYLGSDPNGSAVRDRIRLKSSVSAVYVDGKERQSGNSASTGVDQAWQRGRTDGKIEIELENGPLNDAYVCGTDAYIYGTTLEMLSGEAKGFKAPLESVKNGRLAFSPGFGIEGMLEQISLIKPGDLASLDNSDYIAIQTYHRHQLPDESYIGWDQFRDESGAPIYPQRKILTGPLVALGGAGSIQSGDFSGKMILLGALMDESAFPWQADWYRNKTKEFADDSRFRIWYIDHAIHGDLSSVPGAHHLVPYLGALHQALLDLSDWVERGIEPLSSSVYSIVKGQVKVPEKAQERLGVQPVVHLKANGSDSVAVGVGETVLFTADVELPEGAGRFTSAEWSFDGFEHTFSTDAYPIKGIFIDMNETGTKSSVQSQYAFSHPGTWFPVLRVSSQRQGDASEIFTQVKNLGRVRVTVR
jgi:hypothetical protein